MPYDLARLQYQSVFLLERMDSYTLQIFPAKVVDTTLDAALFSASGVLWKSGNEVDRRNLEIRNNVLSDRQNREYIRWFLEKHAPDDPFNISRADEARRLLETIEVELAGDIAAIEVLQCNSDFDLRVEFHNPPDGNVPLAAYPWEVLQSRKGWHDAGVNLKRCSIERVLSSQEGEPSSLRSIIESLEEAATKPLNILMLTARPDRGRDISSGNVSWPLAKIVSQYPGTSKHACLRLVRPGTWGALKAELEAKEDGFYPIIHLDMHGQIEEKQ